MIVASTVAKIVGVVCKAVKHGATVLQCVRTVYFVCKHEAGGSVREKQAKRDTTARNILR